MHKIALIFCLTLLIEAVAGQAIAVPNSATDPSHCALIPSYAHDKSPVVRKGIFKKAFRAIRSRKWSKGHLEFARVQRTLEASVARLFQSGKNAEISNDDIQRFLSRYVLGPTPVLQAGEYDFFLRPEIAMTWIRAQCEASIKKAEWTALESVPEESHPRVNQSKAAQALLEGDFEEALRRTSTENTEKRDSIEIGVIKALSHAGLLANLEARATAARVSSQCIGPRECAWARWLEATLPPQR